MKDFKLFYHIVGIAADSTSGHLDGVSGLFNHKERSALKDYVAALKDDFLPAGYSKHSGIALRNLCVQRRQGLLCDITLGAEGTDFRIHEWSPRLDAISRTKISKVPDVSV